MGENGAMGAKGATGPTGAIGAMGEPGAMGTPGDSGPVGPTGVGSGTPGATGPTGATGNMGNSGNMGNMGTPGATGAMGTSGAIGPTGAVGTPGTAGAKGATGPTGSNGATGPTGSNGATGPTGSNGSNGPTGGTGPIGLTGGTGPTGNTGATGPTGSFSGNFTGTVTINGMDLFNAAMQDTYPAVLSASNGVGPWCGTAPTTLSVGKTDGYSAAFGVLLTTNQGQISENVHAGLASDVCATGNNPCYGPLTYFLKNPGLARTITVSETILDDAGTIYVEGVQKATTATSAVANPTVAIPTGSFALSFIACSTNGDSLIFHIDSPFITANSLQVDYDRTYHHNGK
jgi:hypothetical protein